MIEWKRFTEAGIDSLFTKREGETKLGEQVQTGDLAASDAPFVILCLAEDLGVQGNLGRPGARNSYKAILAALMNVQNNRFISGEKLFMYGVLEVNTKQELLENIRANTQRIDDALNPVIAEIKAQKKIPIVIGGGHNNAYGCLKGCSEALEKPMAVINIDPHADFRALEGRHSGNGFSYAMNENYLDKYFIYGLHQSYNSESMLNGMETYKGIAWNYFDDIYIQENISETKAIQQAIDFIGTQPCGIELDMDSIALAPTSAITASGLAPDTARKVLYHCAKRLNSAYLHLPELALNLGPEEHRGAWAKLASYLITDFIKAKSDTWKH